MKLRFTIRDLLWLTVVIAIATGWWIERYKRVDVEFWRRMAKERKSYANVDLAQELSPSTRQ